MTLHRCIAVGACVAALAGVATAQQAPSPGPAPTVPAAPGLADKEAAGQLAAQAWLTFLDRRDWGTAWETASAGFRSTVPLGTWMDGIPKLREPLGAAQDRRAVAVVHKTQLQGFPDGDYVTVVFASRYERKELEEIVTTVREADGRWRVNGYGAQ